MIELTTASAVATRYNEPPANYVASSSLRQSGSGSASSIPRPSVFDCPSRPEITGVRGQWVDLSCGIARLLP
jgi:hypothetical protein